jgi:hypothetical protein
MYYAQLIVFVDKDIQMLLEHDVPFYGSELAISITEKSPVSFGTLHNHARYCNIEEAHCHAMNIAKVLHLKITGVILPKRMSLKRFAKLQKEAKVKVGCL